jgi:type I restriction-modification system DNA methylase subunit
MSQKKEKLILETVTAPNLIQNLKMAKELLIDDCKPKIKSLLSSNKEFKALVEQWTTNSQIDSKNEQEIIDKLSKEIAYSFINKIYFYRIAEDKGIVKPKLTKHSLDVLEKSLDVKDIVKAGFSEILRIDYEAIYQDDLLGKYIDFDEDIVRKIIHQLSMFNFGSIDRDILGKVYEQHISREERKQLGQFYTPDWIIKFIIDNIPFKMDYKILDPACGSGGFLLQCYNKLKELYLKDSFAEDVVHNLILKNNLYGFDINPFAVQLTAINLALKDLEHKTDSIHVIETDSLATDLSHWAGVKTKTIENKHKIVVKAGFPRKFNIIVGNPPYFTIKTEDVKKRYPNEDYNFVLKGRTNIASLFIKKYIDYLEDGGYFGFVVPKSLTYVEPWNTTRKFILNNCQIVAIYDLREGFEEVLLEQIAIVLKKTKKIAKDANVMVYHKQKVGKKLKTSTQQINHGLFTEEIFPLYLDDINKSILSKVNSNSILLSKIADITRGAYLQKYKNLMKDKKYSADDLIVISGKDVGRYRVRGKNYLDSKAKEIVEFADKIKRISKEKIMSQRIVAQTGDHIKIIATYDDGSTLNVDTVINIIPKTKDIKTKYILGIVNSKFASYFLYNMIYNRAVRSMNLEYIKYLPIKKARNDVQEKIVELVDKALQSKDNKELERIEEKINNEVYSLYGLSKAEINIVESQI